MEQYIAFDIETATIDFDQFSESQQEYILRGAETEEEKEQKKYLMGLSPFTAQVCCIGMQLMERDGDDYILKSEAALSTLPDYDGEEGKEITLESGKSCFLYTERGLLENFWKLLIKYNNATLISFNGRSFDVPFLMLRSSLLKIRPSKNLMNGTRWNYKGHIDLIDELSFYNPSPYSASKRFNFDFYTRAYGITSPKSEGVDGSMVSELYKKGDIETISDYCLRDINATWELFLIWQKYLKF
jgi:hypothetical protein